MEPQKKNYNNKFRNSIFLFFFSLLLFLFFLWQNTYSREHVIPFPASEFFSTMPLGYAIRLICSKVGIAFPVSHIAITPWIISMFLKVLIIKITSKAITPGGIAVIKTHTCFASVSPHGMGTIFVCTTISHLNICCTWITIPIIFRTLSGRLSAAL